jgi:hypothetical protein
MCSMCPVCAVVWRQVAASNGGLLRGLYIGAAWVLGLMLASVVVVGLKWHEGEGERIAAPAVPDPRLDS